MWSIVPTLIGCWIALAQVLSFSGLAIWVIAGSLVSGWVILGLLRIAKVGLALLAGAGLTVVLVVAAEKFGGSSSGPVTRATLMAVGVTVAMAFVSRTRYPAWMLLPSLMLLGGALGLGSAGQAAWLVAVWVCLSCLTLLNLGPYTAADLSAVARRSSVALLVSGAGILTVVILAIVGSFFSSPWTIDGSGSAIGATTNAVDLTPAPVPTPLSSTASTIVLESSSAPGQEREEQQRFHPLWLIAAFWLAVITAVLAVYSFAERIWIWVRWRRLRRRLRSQDPRASLIGSWTWLRLQLARSGNPLAPHESPDIAGLAASAEGDSELFWLATTASRLAYDSSAIVTNEDSRRAWRIVRERSPGALSGGPLAALRRSGREPISTTVPH
jgi:hypothetical protein